MLDHLETAKAYADFVSSFSMPQTIVDTQKKRISALTASRKLLLESFNTSEGTISSLRSSLSEAKSDLALRVEEVKGYKAQVIELEERLEQAKEKGSEDGKLREKKEQLENEVKELKVRFHFPC